LTAKNKYRKMAARGLRYEKKCAARMRRSGFSGVVLTRAGHDQGIDIIGYRHHRKYGVQCKYYDRPVGNKAVQEAKAGLDYYGCDAAAVVTNTTFTVSARKLAEAADVELWEKNRIPGALTRHFYLTRLVGIVYLLAAIHVLYPYRGIALSALSARPDLWPALLCLAGCLLNILDGWHWPLALAAAVLHGIWAAMVLHAGAGLTVLTHLGALPPQQLLQTALTVCPAVCSLLRILRLKAAGRIRKADRDLR